MELEKDVIQYELAENGLATIWLNRPHKRNCVSPQLLRDLEAAVDKVAAEPKALAVVFRGRGNTFCSGADLDQLVGPVLHETSTSLQLAIDSARTYDKIFNMRKPTIAAVEGYAVAGGFELMISCDFALASSEAKIGDFHIRRALFGGAGPIYRLPRYIGMRKAKELMLTGKLLSGDECAEWGLCNASATPDKFDDLIAEFCQPFLDLSPFCMWMTKMAVNRGMDADTNTLITLETMTCNVVHHSQDAKEGVAAFLGKRKPVWTGN
ncbi:MAG: enoyl-CoA hydratase/isomerase family protein [Brevundimonas sp.]|uniref:Enoyl-CoA hydratase/isomerase family protein n=1 Tax=Brevundimonas albigilva TaxID=1312364 RepID=A0ABY4SPH3_9CAUL|nr:MULTISPECIES: enoyl-CoA hydratase/isomerase family protein [Brevundimonas]PZU62063.1 MAG: enoyl-CoA hydratase/isomerase family protein [Brevundimonas sp.]URI14733.1 enoyl-CoA hydratase/isomerase family protein [Brevundimonas albigilva]